MELNKTIKQNIITAIKKTGKTKKVICENAGIDYNLLSQYQSSPKRKIPHNWILDIAKETGVTVDFIYGK